MLGKQNLQTESNDDYHHPQVSENYVLELSMPKPQSLGLALAHRKEHLLCSS